MERSRGYVGTLGQTPREDSSDDDEALDDETHRVVKVEQTARSSSDDEGQYPDEPPSSSSEEYPLSPNHPIFSPDHQTQKIIKRVEVKNCADEKDDMTSMKGTNKEQPGCNVSIDSVGLEAATHEPSIMSNDLNLEQRLESENTCRNMGTGSTKKRQLPSEEWGPSSPRMTVGFRSTRNRRTSYHCRDTSPVDRMKSGRIKIHHSSNTGSWLMLTRHEEGSRYIPQLRDQVVYLRQGHQEYIISSKSNDAGPWRVVKENIRAVELCEVEGLEYFTIAGSGNSCCKLTLKFVDPESGVFGKSFRLTLPEVIGFPDFLVERSLYDYAMQRNWRFGDKCKVWWKVEGKEDGDWWAGQIVEVKPKSPEFPDSPWERFTIQYKSDPSEKYLHNPWELFDSDTQSEQPHIDDKIRKMLVSAFTKLVPTGKKDYYGVEKLNEISQKFDFINRFSVPLSFEVILSRLKNNYYRSLEAVKHDVGVMMSNAESYFERNAEVSTKMRCLSDWFEQTFSSL